MAAKKEHRAFRAQMETTVDPGFQPCITHKPSAGAQPVAKASSIPSGQLDARGKPEAKMKSFQVAR